MTTNCLFSDSEMVKVFFMLLIVQLNFNNLCASNFGKLEFGSSLSPRAYFSRVYDISYEVLSDRHKIWYSTNDFVCTGVIVHGKWILTAGSCFWNSSRQCFTKEDKIEVRNSDYKINLLSLS